MPLPTHGRTKDQPSIAPAMDDVETMVGELLDVVGSFQQIGIRWSWIDFVDVLTDTARDLAGSIDQWQPAGLDGSHGDLRPDEVAALRGAGFDLESLPSSRDDALARTMLTYACLVATSLSVAEAARLLKLDASRIRQRLAARTLYGIKLRHAWHLPRFQFDGNRVIPGVEIVSPRLREDLHPVAVFKWFTSPDPDLVIEDALPEEKSGESSLPISPRDWLRSGGNPEVVARLAESL